MSHNIYIFGGKIILHVYRFQYEIVKICVYIIQAFISVYVSSIGHSEFLNKERKETKTKENMSQGFVFIRVVKCLSFFFRECEKISHQF